MGISIVPNDERFKFEGRVDRVSYSAAGVITGNQMTISVDGHGSKSGKLGVLTRDILKQNLLESLIRTTTNRQKQNDIDHADRD